ncbi:MAG TPA: 5-dehydro-4-deoxy-D-glucuronate isomerase [Acholeplasmatales bacterium]|nr:MAG: 5-dehydro-4-deoxy-D-glucuronate isomerase [Tenericutes bacterium GWF2_57_13]HAQ55834.1 5-dehydro-4-deoxy-D-glucuronate isomerase [Acholeplasmatales bacterium]
MKFDIRYNNHPEDSKQYDTATLRSRYLIESVFAADELLLTYSHHDRIIAGGAMPVKGELALPTSKDLGTAFFLERRELGVINVGGNGEIVCDGVVYAMGPRDGLYVGAGVREVVFRSLDPAAPAKFYLNSAPAHKSYPIVHIPPSKANPRKIGAAKTLNERTINQYVHPAVCQSCQLVMGLTVLAPGSVWNTMPCHTHERRMEVYFYFGIAPDQRVFHMMGEVSETRHLVIKNEQAVISPSWSIHTGVGTSDYAFIWGMCGENVTFDDMDFASMDDLR